MRRSAAEVIRNLESRVACLEKSASIYELMEDFEFDEGDSPSEIASKISYELGEVFQNVIWQVTDASAVDGQVEFKAQIKGVMPAKMIPMPWSVKNVLTKLQDVAGKGILYYDARMNDSYAMVFADDNEVFGIFPPTITLRFYKGFWNLEIDNLGEEDSLSERVYEFASSLEFKVKSTGSVSEDVDILKSKLKKFLRDYKRYRG